MAARSLGLPKMHKEAGEMRDFLPSFVNRVSRYDIEVVLEYDYGQAMGMEPISYLRANPKARFGPIPEVFGCDMVIVLRFPGIGELQLMKPGSVLVSMVHYETRPDRVQNLIKRNISSISLDSILDDGGERMVENLAGTSWNGMEMAFRALFEKTRGFPSLGKSHITVTIIGMGPVGMYAARAASKYGGIDFNGASVQQKIPGVLVQFATRSVTRGRASLAGIIRGSDILADASRRKDPTVPIIRNDLLGLLPDHAVILDLTADPYNFDVYPYRVKGIEGIPTGSLDRYVFETDHPIYEYLGKYINTHNRRTVVSCNAWPGVKPKECMEIYGCQVSRFFPVLFSKPVQELSTRSEDPLEKALARATLEYYLKYKQKDAGRR